MTQVSQSQLDLLRSKPHFTKLWLSIYKPDTVLSGQVNDGSIAVGEVDITYDNGAGSSANVRSGMTLLVGTAAGKADVGRVRVRSATATVITVAENSHINWQNDLYLTVIDFYEIWPIFPRYFEQNGYVTVYKDYDVAYTNQNETLGSFVCMGSHYAGFVGDVYYTATGTVYVNGNPSSYSWTFEGGSPASSALETPGLVTYNTPGHYTTRLDVTNASGTVDSSYRHISIYDRPEDGIDVPILNWEMDTLSGSRDEGGYSVTIRIHEDISDIVDGSLVVIFADDRYETTDGSIGGNSENRETIFFVGYVLDGTVRYNYDPEGSYVEFDAVSPAGIMQTRSVPSVSVSSASDPVTDANAQGESPWFWIKDMDVQKYLYHFMRWHSTILLTSDFRYIGTNFVFRDQETDPSSLYDSLNSFFESALRGRLVSDRQGLLWGEIGPEATNNATGTFPVGMEILRQDWLDEPDFLERTVPPLSYVEMGGVAWSGAATGTYEAFISEAPGETSAYIGDPDGIQGLILTSQDQLNTLTGNYFAYQNARYPEATFQFAGNYRNLDIAPIENYPITLIASDTRRGFVWTRKPFHITDIDWTFSPENEDLSPEVTLHEITQGYPGHSVPIPETPEPGNPPLPIIPGPIIPPFPIIPPPIGPPPPWVPPPIIPPGDTTCPFDLQAPPNGPFTIHFGNECLGVVLCYDIIGGNYCILWNWTQINFTPIIIRDSAADNPTYIEIDGCWDIIDADSEAILDVWDDVTGLEVSTNLGVPASPIETVGLDSATGNRCEIRRATFDSNLGPYIASGIQIKVDDSTFQCGQPATLSQYSKASAIVWGANLGEFSDTSDDYTGPPFPSWECKHYAMYYLDVSGLSLPTPGDPQITIRNISSNTNEVKMQNTSLLSCPGAGPSPSFFPNMSDASIPAGDTHIFNPGLGNFTFQSGYVCVVNHGGSDANWRIEKLEWVVGAVTYDLWDYQSCRKRLCINSVRLYNICPYDEDTFPP